MTAASFQEIYGRALDRLYADIEAYPTDDSLWTVVPGISNSGGNLCLHLMGNLNHFVGAQLGNTGYVRKRDEEFSTKGLAKTTLLESIDQTKTMLNKVLETLTEADLQKTFPIEMQMGPRNTEYMLTFFIAHFEYHLGQINYHRRQSNS